MEDSIDFLKLYEEIYRILPNGNMQELMEVCHALVGVPIMALDIMYNVLGAAPLEPIGEEMWDMLLKRRSFGTEQIAAMYEEGSLQSINFHSEPYVIDYGVSRDFPKIQGIIKVNDIIEGYVTMACTYEEITPERMQAMDIIMHMCSFFFQYTDSESSMNDTHQKVFAGELFNNRITTDEQLEMWFRDMNCEISEPYTVAAITVANPYKKGPLSHIRSSLQQLLQMGELLLIQNNILYILFYQIESRILNSILENDLKKVLVKYQAHCGISNPFESLLHIAAYQKQAEDALMLGSSLERNRRIHYYANVTLPAMIMPCIHNIPRESYVPEILFEMERYDRFNSTEFLPTLSCYVHNLGNSLDTSKDLHIHRNTLSYRLNKMETLFHISLKDYNVMMHVMLAFYMQELEKII